MKELAQRRKGAKEHEMGTATGSAPENDLAHDIGLLINFGAHLIKDGITRLVNGLPD
jgi:hypothetical protein